jgi:hypothetical protein
MQTDFEFTLPRGYLDQSGRLHQTGRMRLAYALDEVEVVQDPRVQLNEAYLPIVLLSRVVTQLGEISPVPPEVIEHLFAADMAFLEDLYLRVNSQEITWVSTICPRCNSQINVQVAPLQG